MHSSTNAVPVNRPHAEQSRSQHGQHLRLLSRSRLQWGQRPGGEGRGWPAILTPSSSPELSKSLSNCSRRGWIAILVAVGSRPAGDTIRTPPSALILNPRQLISCSNSSAVIESPICYRPRFWFGPKHPRPSSSLDQENTPEQRRRWRTRMTRMDEDVSARSEIQRLHTQPSEPPGSARRPCR